ncbi:MAG: GGDEF domain-containing protein [Anaerolineales bacterium]|nr:GGDEF domain-containing protein [Anaerolineales bacterium]
MDDYIYRISPSKIIVIVLSISTLIVLAYTVWVFGFHVVPHFDLALSSWAIIALLFLASLLGGYLTLQKSINVHIRRGWTLITLAVISKLVGEGISFIMVMTPGTISNSFLSDILLSLYYPLFFAGILNFPFSPLKRKDYLLFLLDVAIVMVAVGMVFWYFILMPITLATETGPARIFTMAYPTGDLILLTGLVVINQREIHGINRVSLVFLVVSILLASIPDAIYSFMEHNQIRSPLSNLNIFWLASVLCLIFATAKQIRNQDMDKPFTAENLPVLKRMLPPYIAAGIVPVLMIGIINPNAICQPQFRGLLVGVVVLLVLVFSRQHVVLMDNYRLYRFTRKQATIDGLTKVYNRQYLNEVFPQEVEEARRFERKLSVLLVDVDRFKSFNDTFGHVTGDNVLKTIADILASHIRQSDILARYGGDEFAIILKDTDLKGAKIVSDKIQMAVASQSIADRPLGVSVGEAQLMGDQTPENMLEEADRDLYQDKALKKIQR